MRPQDGKTAERLMAHRTRGPAIVHGQVRPTRPLVRKHASAHWTYEFALGRNDFASPRGRLVAAG